MPTRGDAAIAARSIGSRAAAMKALGARGRAAVTCLFGLGLGVEVAERRVLATLTRGGVFACACAAAMFYVLWYVPS